MTIVKTITSLPPLIQEHFSADLLSIPVKLRDSTETLWKMYVYIKTKLMHKANYNPFWKAKCERLEKEFLELYEQAKAKEKDIKAKTGNEAKEPFYYIGITDRRHENIFKGLRYSYYKVYTAARRSYEI